jgi:hypothetical protein
MKIYKTFSQFYTRYNDAWHAKKFVSSLMCSETDSNFFKKTQHISEGSNLNTLYIEPETHLAETMESEQNKTLACDFSITQEENPWLY